MTLLHYITSRAHTHLSSCLKLFIHLAPLTDQPSLSGKSACLAPATTSGKTVIIFELLMVFQNHFSYNVLLADSRAHAVAHTQPHTHPTHHYTLLYYPTLCYTHTARLLHSPLLACCRLPLRSHSLALATRLSRSLPLSLTLAGFVPGLPFKIMLICSASTMQLLL